MSRKLKKTERTECIFDIEDHALDFQTIETVIDYFAKLLAKSVHDTKYVKPNIITSKIVAVIINPAHSLKNFLYRIP